MKLISLWLHNFMPFKGDAVLAFPQATHRNVLVVFGDNMRGKTSLLNALRWVLYGRAVGRHQREIPTHMLLNKEAALEADWEFEVRLQFEANGHNYDLRRRGTKRQLIAQPSRPEDFETVVGLQKDGMAVSGQMVEVEINRFAPEQVSRFFLFDGELLQDYEALLIEGSEQGRRIKEAIEQVLGVPTLINGRLEAATLLKTAQKQQNRDLTHIQGIEKQAEKQASLQRKQEQLEQDHATLTAKANDAKGQREQIDDELERTETLFESKQRLDLHRKRKREILETQNELRGERLAQLRDVWRDFLQPKLLVRHRYLLEEQKRATRKIGERSRLEGKISDLRHLLTNADCPTCGQEVGQDRREQIGAALGEIEGQLTGMNVDERALNRVAAEISDIGGMIRAGVSDRLVSNEQSQRKLSVELTKVESEMNEIEEGLRGFDSADTLRKRALRDGLLREEARLERDIDDRAKQIVDVKRELAINARALQALPAARAARSTRVAEVCAALEKAFEASIDRLRDNLRERVGRNATEAFLRLTSQSAYKGLEINKNYGLSILDEAGRTVSLRSAGAEQIVALSLIDGLARTGRAAGPVVMDTPFGRLDLKHRDNILKYLPTTASQLVLLVHDGEIRRDTDLAPIAERIGAAYEINEVSPRHSRLDRVHS